MIEHDPVIQPMLSISCPICQKRGEVMTIDEWPQFPFCSPRCKLIDLGRWLGEDYCLPDADEPVDPESDSPAI